MIQDGETIAAPNDHVITGQVRSSMGAYAGPARRLVHLARRYFVGLRLAIAQADARPVMLIFLSDRTPPDPTMKPVDAPSA